MICSATAGTWGTWDAGVTWPAADGASPGIGAALMGASGAARPIWSWLPCGTRGGFAVNSVSPLRLSTRSIRYGLIL
ncbi:hypothetical protein WR25_11170 [Diploscapter pachys]|uniref:Uncharacterized protein n=1 Tax=Diploscapter pachys TaxID=2018661 RepID=A0A2A2M630_9BILA|nr:hypothetical protein WR25_11170 [Diploscapter pachys]